ncbi:MAG: hypothetical protein AAGI52_03340 [Bacteroidota bacterium]
MAGGPLRRLRALFPRARTSGEPERTRNGLAMALSFVVAFVLWFTFSMQETYTTTVEVALEVADLPDGQALRALPPQTARVSLQGRGEDLFTLSWSPLPVQLFADGPTVSVADAVAEAGLPTGVTVLSAQPRTIRLELDELVQRDLPVRLDGRVRASAPFDLLSPPRLEPDSIRVTGARGLLDGFDHWPTARFLRDDLRDNLRTPVALSDTLADLVDLSRQSVMLLADVAEFTSDELVLTVEVENLPPGVGIRFEPGTVRAPFSAPIGDAFDRVMQVGFRAVVDYEDIVRDPGTGTVNVSARIPSALDARNVRFEPSRVDYFFLRRDTTEAPVE